MEASSQFKSSGLNAIEAEIVPVGKGARPLQRHQLVAQSEAAVRRKQAWELRLQGYSLREIGAEIGVSHESARKYVSDTLGELETQSKSSAKDWRTAEIERKRELLKVWFPAALEPSMDGARAVAVVLKVEEQLAELLGTNALPAQNDTSEEDMLERCLLNDRTMEIYALYGVYSGPELEKVVALCGGDPSKIPAPRRRFQQG
jgi:hypothetical protein